MGFLTADVCNVVYISATHDKILVQSMGRNRQCNPIVRFRSLFQDAVNHTQVLLFSTDYKWK